MAKVLGVQGFSFGQASSLVIDGKITSFIEDEKLTQRKGEKGNFPVDSIKYCLSQADLKIDDIDEVVLPWMPFTLFLTAARHGLVSMLRALLPYPKNSHAGREHQSVSLFFDRFLVLVKHGPFFMRHLTRHYLKFSLKAQKLPRIRFVSHHLSHAASSFYLSGYDEASVIVVDGLGDFETASIWRGQGKSLKRLHSVKFPNSLGETYAAFTQYLGFKPYCDEGKVMGLAAYGNLDVDIVKKVERVLTVNNESYFVNSRYTIDGDHRFGTYFADKLVDLFGPCRWPDDPIEQKHKDIALSIQDRIEKAVIAYVRKAVNLTSCQNVCLAGGVAMNCKINGAVLEQDFVKNLFVMPAANDAGAGLGASLYRSVQLGDDPRTLLTHTYFGPGLKDTEIESELKKLGVQYAELDDLSNVADDLCDGKIIGIYSGRMEFGARALGARSILANPAIPGMKDRVNNVKFRESWRPFAPVILEGFEREYFEHGEISHFMMKTFTASERTRTVAPQIVHVDNTCRPQSINRSINETYYDILEAFYRKTGIPMLMNTSLNLRGDPIACTPRDALKVFFLSKMDNILLGSFYLSKDRK